VGRQAERSYNHRLDTGVGRFESAGMRPIRSPVTSRRTGRTRQGGRTAPAFEAIARTLALGSVGYESEPNERGERLIWLEPLLARQLVRLTVLSAQTSTLDASVD
jgi:hypothetical protein